MAKIPDNTAPAFWIFPDSVIPTEELKLLQFEPEYETKKGNSLPVFVFYGKILGRDDKVLAGELNMASWNIENLEELKNEFGEDSDNWPKDLRFTAHPSEKDPKRKIILRVVEAVKEE